MDIFSLLPEWPLTTILLVIFSISFIFLYTLRSNRRPSYNLPPGPPTLPIIGNLHQLCRESRYDALDRLYKQYGPIMQFRIGSKQFLVISSASMAQQILKTQDHVFCSRDPFHTTKRLTYNFVDIAFSPPNSHWREMRKLLVSELLGSKRAKLSDRVLVTLLESTIRSLLLISGQKAVNLSDIFLDLVKQRMCKVAFGNKYREQPLNGMSWCVMLDEAMELLNESVGDCFPFLGFFIDILSGRNRRLNDGFKVLDSYFNTIIDDHQKNNTDEEISEEDKDFVQIILDMSSKKIASGYRPTNTDLKALMLDILTAGNDTTYATLTWAMTEISKNVRVMQKVQSEIRNCTGRIQNVNEMDTTKMTYLKMVVKETLRVHPPAPLLIPRLSLNHAKIAGFDVFPNTVVLINVRGIGLDPSTWGENANEFYPERFEELDGSFGIDRFEMIPFGGGRRSCPAMNYAPDMIEFVLANLFYWFDWELPSGMKSEDLNMEEAGSVVVGKKIPLCLVPTKHKW